MSQPASKSVFAAEAERYRAAGYAPLPIVPRSKRPAVSEWQKYADGLPEETLRRWMDQLQDCGIGLALGIRRGDLQLVAVDIDADDLVDDVVHALGGAPCAKKGRKGLTVFCLASPDIRNEKIRRRSADGKALPHPAVEILARGSQTVIPPSPHPDGAEYAYRWVGRSLLDVVLDELPILNESSLDEIRALCGGDGAQHFGALNQMTWRGVGGGGDTHDTCVAAVACMVARGWKDADIHARVERAKREACKRAGEDYHWPQSRKVIQEWIDSARVKGFGDVMPAVGRKIPAERDAAQRWIAAHGGPQRLVAFGNTVRMYREDEGYWAVYPDELIRRELAEDPSLSVRSIENALKAIHMTLYRPAFGERTAPRSICVANGVLNLESAQLDKHSPDYEFTSRVPVEWDEEARCPQYEATLERIFDGDGECIDALEEFSAYTWMPDVRQQKSLWLFGPAAAGKGTLTNLLQSMHSPEAVSALSITALNDPKVRAHLVGRKVNISTEQSKLYPIADAYFKAIVGGDPVDVWVLYRGTFTVTLTVRFVLSGNEMPPTSDTSSAFARRLIILPCRNPIDKERQDPGFLDQLLAERRGILVRWQRAAKQFFRRGRLLVPAASRREVERYIASQDVIGYIFNEVLEFPDTEEQRAEFFTPAGDIIMAVRFHADEIGARLPAAPQWMERLTDLGYPSVLRRIKDQVVRGRQVKIKPTSLPVYVGPAS